MKSPFGVIVNESPKHKSKIGPVEVVLPVMLVLNVPASTGQLQSAGWLNGNDVMVHEGSAENVATTSQFVVPFGVIPVIAQFKGLVNGALYDTLFPLQSVSVNVPVDGGLINSSVPVMSKVFVTVLHGS